MSVASEYSTISFIIFWDFSMFCQIFLYHKWNDERLFFKTFPVVRYFTWKLESVSNILWVIVVYLYMIFLFFLQMLLHKVLTSLLNCVPYVLTCSCANVPCALTCWRADVLCALTCQRALRDYVLTCKCALRVYVLMPCVLCVLTYQSVLRALRTYVLTCHNYK